MKTILITGCSSGFGLDTARYFLERDWNVVATMRTVDASLLPASPNLRLLALDVTDAASIDQAIAAAGPIDVLVNNAGIGMLAALEGTSMDIARDVFATNTLGTIAMTQAVLPQFRARGAGVVINVTSTVTVVPLPFLSVYTASKAAVNAFTECLAVELASFAVLRGSQFARWIGITGGALLAISAFWWMPYYPVWSLAYVLIGVLVLYGLAAYGGRDDVTA